MQEPKAKCEAVCPKDGMRCISDHRHDTPRSHGHMHLDLKENLCFFD